MKLLEKFSDPQLLKKDCRLRLVSNCSFINVASNAFGPLRPANQY